MKGKKVVENKDIKNEKVALIVSGESLLHIMASKEIKEQFLEVSIKCDVVLACRVSPKQKADIV